MTWDFRVIKENGQAYIGEVYYENGKRVAHTGPVELYGDDLLDLIWAWFHMGKAFFKPTLTKDDF
jgi:hypothetical protein